MRFRLYVCFLLCAQVSIAQIDHWESVIVPGNLARYQVPSSEPNVNWTDLSFDDSSWNLGSSGFGYGDGDDTTELSPPVLSVYFRHSFDIIDLAAIESLLLHMDFDDGFVAYLNGTEIARAFMSGNPPAFNQTSDGLHEALLYQSVIPEQFSIDPELLNEGENILAVQVHNQSENSSDLSALAVLSVGINNTSTNYFSVPFWFEPPTDFTSSNLPLIFIETEGGAQIPDEPKIAASMKIVYRGPGERTFITDQDAPEHLDYEGNIRIEVRGSSSQVLPKKQYGFTTYNITGTTKENVELLNMPEENDWILNGLAFDPSLMRDYISYNLSRYIGEYASRTQYCEMFLNGSYQGLYVLQEKMKKDDSRIDIKPVGDNADGNITGGYITKSDKITASDPEAWFSAGVSYTHVEPKPDEVTAEQENYIRGIFSSLESRTAASNSNITTGYPSIIDMSSFIHFMILNELAGNVDGYQFSTYYHKDVDGKLRAGPIWDFNLTFGNDLFIFGFDRSHPDIWQFDDGENEGSQFWKDLFADEVFNCYLTNKWIELTSAGKPLNINSINRLIDETADLISEARVREQSKWGTVADHEANIEDMKIWISDRIDWMTAELGPSSDCNGSATPPLVISKIDYHPDFDLIGGSSDQEYIEITNNSSSSVDLSGIYFGSTGFTYQFRSGERLSAGERIVLANDLETYQVKFRETAYDEFSRNLSNSGDELVLLTAYGEIIDEVIYDDKSPWPELADGEGYYLQLNDLNADNNDPANWSAVADPVVITSITEVMANGLSISPNPSRDKFNVKSNELIMKLQVTDIRGRVVATYNYPEKRYSLDLSGFPEGMYFVKADVNMTSTTIRIIKN